MTKLLPYGAFVELEKGGRPGARFRVVLGQENHPSERCIEAGPGNRSRCSSISVKEQKISLVSASWKTIPGRISNPVSRLVPSSRARVRNLTPYGAFVGLEEGIDGMIHVSDMSGTRKINHPSEVLKKGDEVEAIVLEIKKEDQRVSLGIKQLESDPWESINDRFKVGDMVTGPGPRLPASAPL